MSRSTSPKRRGNPPPHNAQKVCLRTDKLCYRSRKIALGAKNQICSPHSRTTASTRPTGVYKCEFCNYWHLTSREERECTE